MNNVKEIRLRKGVSQSELAIGAGVSSPYIYDLERGHRNARPETWERIAQVLGVSIEELICEKREQSDDAEGNGV